MNFIYSYLKTKWKQKKLSLTDIKEEYEFVAVWNLSIQEIRRKSAKKGKSSEETN